MASGDGVNGWIVRLLPVAVRAARRPDADWLSALVRRRARFAASEKTMRNRPTARDLLPNVLTVPSGTAEVICRQRASVAYFKL
ncbi:MAG: hypothetical protein KatS3mg108_2844 [Isosphaeraceae bacterium]|nr:MAG: hypothetical protein KatS3mg108_2844 [Isosphaeraceae bacterium]